jgi:hypothetical protein
MQPAHTKLKINIIRPRINRMTETNTREREHALAKARLVYFIDSPRAEQSSNARLPQVAKPQKVNDPVIGAPIVAARLYLDNTLIHLHEMLRSVSF